MVLEEQFIDSIHNYCDGWCERCDFTMRCHVFAAEQELTDDENDIGNPAFFRSLKNMFAEAKDMLAAKAAEFGIEIEPLSNEEYAEIRARERAFVKGEKIAGLAEKYAWYARPILATKDEWIDPTPGDDMPNEMIAILYWYQFFIAAKIERGLHGILDFDGAEDIDEINDIQSDANGSIKIALIAIERSVLAWTYLLSPQNTPVISPLIKLLENIRHLAEQKFPNARSFVRPGFDEIETVM